MEQGRDSTETLYLKANIVFFSSVCLLSKERKLQLIFLNNNSLQKQHGIFSYNYRPGVTSSHSPSTAKNLWIQKQLGGLLFISRGLVEGIVGEGGEQKQERLSAPLSTPGKHNHTLYSPKPFTYALSWTKKFQVQEAQPIASPNKTSDH